MTTEEGNLLIAKFMGITGTYAYMKEYTRCSMYHYSWNSIMPVVEKIESMDRSIYIEIGNKVCCVSKLNPNNITQYEIYSTHIGKTKIEAVWLAVIEFIQWFKGKNIEIREV